ncbi:MAG: alanine racemase [Candidatus Sumerlaeota bacterium]|nr:alanine racemase [Candidatus Sumerlaeota bacterium]
MALSAQISAFYPAWMEIDLDAIAHNLRLMRRQVGEATMIYPVVKSNAYGHGLVPVSRRLLAEGADGVCIARLWEADALRRAGVESPIVCLTSVFPEEARHAVDLNLEVVVFRKEASEALSQAARAAGRTMRVHVKVDCGMGRLGVWPDDAVEFARFIQRFEGLELYGLMSHFSNADDEEDAVSVQQMAVYGQVRKAFHDAGLPPMVCHHCNSDATMRFEPSRRQLVRPGIAIYGCYPSDWYRRHFELKPAMSVRARLASLRRFPPGKGLSYSQEFVTRRDSLIGVVQCGYADGYLRALKGKTSMLVRSARVPVVGRICMEQSLLDLTDVPHVEYGDIVTVLGADGAARVTAEELGAWAGTINYEIVTHLGRQFPRFYFDNGKCWEE